jgi:hypothetical protein
MRPTLAAEALQRTLTQYLSTTFGLAERQVQVILQQRPEQLPALTGQTFLQLGVGLPVGICSGQPATTCSKHARDRPNASAASSAYPDIGLLLQLWIFVDPTTYEKEPSNTRSDTTIPIRRLRTGRQPPCKGAAPNWFCSRGVRQFSPEEHRASCTPPGAAGA